MIANDRLVQYIPHRAFREWAAIGGLYSYYHDFAVVDRLARLFRGRCAEVLGARRDVALVVEPLQFEAHLRIVDGRLLRFLERLLVAEALRRAPDG